VLSYADSIAVHNGQACHADITIYLDGSVCCITYRRHNPVTDGAAHAAQKLSDRKHFKSIPLSEIRV
jgi:hypothetical protein